MKEELAELRGRVEDKCGDCEHKSTCLMREENKRGHKENNSMTEAQELEMAVEALEAFNRAGISYRVCEDGSFDFYSEQDHECAQVIAKEIEKKY